VIALLPAATAQASLARIRDRAQAAASAPAPAPAWEPALREAEEALEQFLHAQPTAAAK
jgi:hypothetical protein